jgi:hypothetical protein
VFGFHITFDDWSKRMDRILSKAKRADFETWSGGFPPESDEQIFLYIEMARPIETVEVDVAEILRTWMREEESTASRE